MAGERETVERLFAAALELAPEDRSVFLKRACRESPELEPLVRELLDKDERLGSFLEQPFLDPRKAAAQFAPFDDKSAPANSYGTGSHAGASPRWNVGSVLNDRFVIVRYIARGGMGEVYEVEDRRLQGVHLGLKTLLSQSAEDPVMQKRLEREILHAREVIHPNLCPIYDIFQSEDQGKPIAFFTMKLLSGETLAMRIARQGPIDLPEATAIIRQVGDALGAIHDAGILHRDIKAGNIMLDGHGAEVRVCVMDFGLAHAYQAGSQTLTTAAFAGTPAYMAPELFRGEQPSIATDVYAIAIVAYEMLMGHVPRFSPGNELETGQDPVFDKLPSQWKRFIRGCLEPDATRRFPSVRQAVAVLQPGYVAPPPPPAVSSRHAISRRKMLEMGAGATVALAGGAWLEWPRIDRWMHPLPDKRFVAVMAWPAPTGESSSLVSTVLGSIRNRLTRAEAYVKNLLVISAGDVPGTVPVVAPAESVSLLGANLVLAASLQTKATGAQLLLQVLDAASQRTLRKQSIATSRDQINTLADRGSEEAAKLLGLPQQEKRLKDDEELKTISPEAFQLFSQAEELAHQPNNTGLDAAILKYADCLGMEPRFHLGYAKLAMAYVQQYLRTHDRALLSLAERNAERAADENSASAAGLLSRAQVYLFSGRQEEALTFIGRSLKVDPGNSETILYKTYALRFLNRLAEAEQVYREILKERPNYWPAYNELAYVLWRQAKYQQAADAFAEAAVAAPSVAMPLANLGTMYVAIGKHDEAIDASRRSIARSPNANAFRNLGDEAFTDKDYKAALGYYEQAAQLEPRSHLAWRDIGDCYAMLGNSAKVHENYQRAAKVLSEDLQVNPRNGFRWMTLAFYHAKVGDSVSAVKDIENAEKYGASDVRSKFMKVQALTLLGKKQEALTLLLECVKEGLSPVEIDLALDLKDLRKDPRYLSVIAKTPSNQSAAT
ncbi:serine/threonine-protein kinase [Edaphobacter aggregans]|uniref:serine/threonine-protein kinase n=1 Tax=Edaphobacter aggregans TaxID=570835 RepID=UPI00055677D6|nr:serine/threonine-protein kinase [Edaphobacter aggregans]